MKKRTLWSSLVVGAGLLVTAFTALCDDTIHLAAYHGNEQKVIELLVTNPDPDERDAYGGTALHAAMFQDNIRIVQLLIDAGWDVNAIGPSNGYTPLHDAVWGNNLSALELLVENGGDMSVKGHDGYTPLEKARRENKTALVVYLESVAKGK